MSQISAKPPAILREAEVEIDSVILDENELARHSPEQIEQLAADIAANGLLQPIAITEDKRAIFGHGRILAKKKLGLKTIRAVIYASGLTENQFKLIRAAENIHRTDLTPYRKWMLCVELLCGNPDWDQQTLATHLHLSQPNITKILSPSKCTEEWQEALRAGKVSISDCYAASKVEKSKQAGLLALRLAGANREQLEQEGRKQRTPESKTVRLSRVRCALPSGVCITVAGEALSLDDLIEAFADATKEAKKAREQGLDAKTFQFVLRDKARGK